MRDDLIPCRCVRRDPTLVIALKKCSCSELLTLQLMGVSSRLPLRNLREFNFESPNNVQERI